jgi:hypothetical protein
MSLSVPFLVTHLYFSLKSPTTTDDLQKVTDDFIKKLDQLLKSKEDQLMKV